MIFPYLGGESSVENFTRIKGFEELCNKHIYHILKGIKWTNKNKPFPTSNTSINNNRICKR
jgi:hypothetical protein